MQGNPSRRAVLRAMLSTAASMGLGMALPGCGTIFYPERKGQPAGRLDWKVVALDTVGLIFFFIPGVIAFAVDFNNGTIYLPPDECADKDHRQRHGGLVSVPLNEKRPTLTDVERTVSRETARDIRLVAGKYRSQPMQDVGEFEGLRITEQLTIEKTPES